MYLLIEEHANGTCPYIMILAKLLNDQFIAYPYGCRIAWSRNFDITNVYKFELKHKWNAPKNHSYDKIWNLLYWHSQKEQWCQLWPVLVQVQKLEKKSKNKINIVAKNTKLK